MVDNVSKKQRSETMSKIKSKWTNPERKFHNYLKSYKIKHKMYPKIVGNPDVFLAEENAVVFIQGCFWHKCPKHYRQPHSDKKYWLEKIKRNIARDKQSHKFLRQQGFKVLIIWEHELKDIERIINKIKSI